MKHPYEVGALVFTVALIAGLLTGIAFKDVTMPVDAEPNMGYGEFKEYRMGDQYNNGGYYDKVYEIQGDCKKQAYDLQDFYECVNIP
jgi:hypothetical protein